MRKNIRPALALICLSVSAPTMAMSAESVSAVVTAQISDSTMSPVISYTTSTVTVVSEDVSPPCMCPICTGQSPVM